MAILLPLLALLVFGIVEFSLMYNRAQSMQAGAREGARIASIGRDAPTVTTAARNSLGIIDPDDVAVCVGRDVPGADCNAALPHCEAIGDFVRVSLTVDAAEASRYRLNIPFVNLNPLAQYEARGVFRCEQVAS